MQRFAKGMLVALLLSLFAGLAFAQVHINEVNPAGQWVELFNSGEDAVDVSGWALCNFPEYAPMSGAEIVSGELVIPAGGYLVVRWDKFSTTDGEVGIYSSGGEWGDASTIVDYMQYGSAGHKRETVGEEAGVWNVGLTLDLPGEDQSLIFVGMSDDHGANWDVGAATPGAVNQ